MARENDYMVGFTTRRSMRNNSSLFINQGLETKDLTSMVFWNDWIFGVLSVKLNSGVLDSQTDIGSSARLVLDSSGVLRHRAPTTGDKTVKFLNDELIAV